MASEDFPSTKNIVDKGAWTDERRAKAIPVEPPTKPPVSGEVLEPQSTPPPAPAPTKITGSAYNGWPYSAIGKIYFTSSDGNDYVATGWMLAFSDPSGRMPVIMTAAHVLWDLALKTWSTNVHIVIDQGGDSPVTVWPTGLQVTSAWQQQPNYSSGIPYDYACCYVDRNDWAGQVLPAQWNQNAINSSQHAVGYPSVANNGYPFDGGSQWDQSGDMYSTASPPSGDGEFDMASWLSPGASGGPWIGWSNDARWVQGLQSGWYGADSGRCITPYFGTTFAALMNWAKQEWPNYAH